MERSVNRTDSPALDAPPAEGPRPTLGGRHVAAIVVGIVIGAGIFRTPSLVAGVAGSEEAFLVAWLAGGILSIIGALCYAELAAAFPSAGGDYHFLSRAFGRRLGFLYAWARLSVIQTGSLTLLAFLFGDYASELLPLGPQGPAIYAAAAVIALTAINWRSEEHTSELQSLMRISYAVFCLTKKTTKNQMAIT